MVQSFCVSSFLLGGFAAVIVMGLVLLFMEDPLKKSKNNQVLRIKVKEFLRLAQTGDSDEMPGRPIAKKAEDSKNPQERISIIQRLAAGKLGKEYTHASGLLQ